MNTQNPKDIRRFAKGARAAVSDLRIVLDERSILCPECRDDPGELPCLRCNNVGFIIPDTAGLDGEGDNP